ncbi:MAG: hypothetical protein JSS61_07510 [Verrucomicrobia bacterium]|nr:hypothetical protein [Verrucomicrobiota bacterium]
MNLLMAHELGLLPRPHMVPSPQIKPVPSVIPPRLRPECPIAPVDPRETLSGFALDGLTVAGACTSSGRAVYRLGLRVLEAPFSHSMQAFAVPSMVSLLSGPRSVKGGIQQIQEAGKANDVWGASLGSIKVVSGCGNTLLGVIALPSIALSLSTSFTSSRFTHVALSVLGKIGSGLSAITSFLSIIGNSLKVHEGRLLRSALMEILNDPNLSQEEREKKAFCYLKEQVTFGPEEKKASIARASSKECVELLQKKGMESAKEVVAKVLDQNLEGLVLSGISLSLACISILCAVAAFVFTGPAALTVFAAVGLVTSVAWLCIETYGFIQGLGSAKPGQWDKVLLIASSVAAIACTVFACVCSGGIAPIVVAVVLGGSWLAVNAFCYIWIANKPYTQIERKVL